MKPPAIILQRYRLGRCLSQKPGRATYLAHDQLKDQRVVVKLLVFSYDFEWQWLKLFEREAQLLNQLDHPGIPSYLDYSDINETDFKGFALVQTYIDAPSLAEQMSQGRRFTTDEIRQLATSLLEILIYLQGYQSPILHRDIKPSNVLLCDRTAHSPGQVYLVDFGAAQAALPATEGTFTVVGSYGYTAPEQFAGRATSASDLYSLAATLVHLATGQHPADLPRKHGMPKLQNILADDIALRQWLQKLLNLDPEERLPDAQAALSALQTKDLGRDIILAPAPSQARCSLHSTGETFTVLAPPQIPSLPGMGCGLILGALLISGLVVPAFTGITAYVVLGGIVLGSVALGNLLWRRHRYLVKNGNIKLQIDAKTISLWKVGYKEVRLQQHLRTGQLKVERVTEHYMSVTQANGKITRRNKESNKAYVQIAIQNIPSARNVTLVAVGNRRSYWLSTAESQWLATTLGDWLQCPVIEVEVREKQNT